MKFRISLSADQLRIKITQLSLLIHFQVWFQNSRARQKKHQLTTSTSGPMLHSRLAVGLTTSHTGSVSISQLNNNNNNNGVIGPTMTSSHSPAPPAPGATPSAAALAAAQSIVSHHPASAAVAVLSAAAAATYMNINIRNSIQAALHGQGQGPAGQGHHVTTTPPVFDGERSSSSPSEQMQPAASDDTNNLR